MKSNFILVPFAANTAPRINLAGNINRHNNLLTIEYQLTGNLNLIYLSKPVINPLRKNSLWTHTCFEFFLGITNTAQYWEFNLSPTGHWNVYNFNNYRKDLVEEIAFQDLPFTLTSESNLLQLNIALSLDKIITAQQNLQVAISAVIEDQNQQLSYWALSHPQPEPDFHHRDSFLINL